MHPPDDLRALLHEWRETPAPDPTLAASLARELAERRTARSRWRRLGDRLGGGHWPRLAAACVAAGIVIGVAGAEWRRAQESREMPARYLRWIDPVNFAGDVGMRGQR